MSVLIKLFRKSGDTIDLYGGDDGFKIRHDGWLQKVAAQNPDGSWNPVQEVINLRAHAGTHNDLAIRVQKLDRMLRRGNEFTNRSFAHLARKPVFLRVRLRDETNTRQSMVYMGRVEPRQGFLGPPVTPIGKMGSAVAVTADTVYSVVPDYRLGLMRHPFWEATTATDAYLGRDIAARWYINCLGGMAEYNSIPGDVPGRINSFYFTVVSPASEQYEAWAGFRSDEYGDRTKFKPNWDIGDADTDVQNNTARVTTFSSAINGQGARWTPGGGADNLILPRTTTSLWYVTDDWREQCGTFIALLRAKVSSGGDRTFRVRMKSGYFDSDEAGVWRTGARVTVPASGVSAGDWYYYPMGIVTIPPDRVPVSNVLLTYFSLRVEAEVASGTTGNLDLDAFTLIPVGEGGIHVKGAVITGTRTTYIQSSPDDELIAYSTSGGGGFGADHKAVEFEPYHWGVPTGNGRLVVAAQRETESSKGDKIQNWFDYYPRWLTMRGAE